MITQSSKLPPPQDTTPVPSLDELQAVLAKARADVQSSMRRIDEALQWPPIKVRPASSFGVEFGAIDAVRQGEWK